MVKMNCYFKNKNKNKNKLMRQGFQRRVLKAHFGCDAVDRWTDGAGGLFEAILDTGGMQDVC